MITYRTIYNITELTEQCRFLIEVKIVFVRGKAGGETIIQGLQWHQPPLQLQPFFTGYFIYLCYYILLPCIEAARLEEADGATALSPTQKLQAAKSLTYKVDSLRVEIEKRFDQALYHL
eukprot:snap_masked-scaffold_8-processed-gene-3.38-mRNA-1 protein AED:1.00 eAED:1.00 QI:0/0/0/0/1/1/3/0/118